VAVHGAETSRVLNGLAQIEVALVDILPAVAFAVVDR